MVMLIRQITDKTILQLHRSPATKNESEIMLLTPLTGTPARTVSLRSP